MTTLSYDSSSFYVQALASSISKRLLDERDNSLLLNIAPTGRQAKRIAQQINYSEDYTDDFDFEDSPTSTFGTKGNAGTQSTTSAQKYSAARKTPVIKSFEDEQKITDLGSKSDVLVPIKLSLENSNSTHKLADFFMWNLTESLVTPSEFAEILCGDLELPSTMSLQIAESIIQQIEEYSYASNLQLPNNNPCNVIIDLSVNLNKQLFQDRFEWDLNQKEITPEEFALIIVSDLGLSLEFKPAISHALHEIILRAKKEIIDGTFNNEIHNLHLVRGIIFENGIRVFTETSVQNGNDHWEPLVETLTSSEIERRENERIRNLRRLKRENMKRDYDDYSGAKRRHVGRRRLEELDWRGV